MTRVLVNDEQKTLESGPKTWADLLDWADREGQGRGELVTAVRLDGVDQPSFRRAALGGEALPGVATIEIQTQAPVPLVADSLAEAVRGLSALRQHVPLVARGFRGHDMAAANASLAELTLGLQTLLAVADSVARVLGLDLAAVDWDGRSLIDRMAGLGRTLEACVEAQAASDWITLADILDDDMEPALAEWVPVFAALATAAEDARARVASAARQ